MSLVSLTAAGSAVCLQLGEHFNNFSPCPSLPRLQERVDLPLMTSAVEVDEKKLCRAVFVLSAGCAEWSD